MEGSYQGSLNLRNNSRFQFVREKIYDQKIGFGICSFSETHDNSPMWAHYADQFQGMCIAYNFRALMNALSDQCSFVRISYEDDPCVVTQDMLSNGEIAQRILSSKSHRWLYEREWRLFSSSPGRLEISTNCISRVYFGNRMVGQCRENLLDILADRHIEARAMELDGYKVSFSEIRGNSFTVRPNFEDEI